MTPRLLRTISVSGMVAAIVVAVVSLIFGVNGLVSGEPGAALLGLVVVPGFAFLLLLVIRLLLELTMVALDIAANLTSVRRPDDPPRPTEPPNLRS